MLAPNGKMRLTDVADTEKLFRLVQSIPSPKAEPLKFWLAQVASERLDDKVVARNFRMTTRHGAIEGKTQKSTIKLFNLDVIISVGYRVKSQRGTQFRIWATKRINEYIRKGFTMDDERLKNLGGCYGKELLQRISDIRASKNVTDHNKILVFPFCRLSELPISRTELMAEDRRPERATALPYKNFAVLEVSYQVISSYFL